MIGRLEKVTQFRFQDTEDICLPKAKVYSKKRADVLELSRGRLYPLFSGNNDISLCKGSKCRDDC